MILKETTKSLIELKDGFIFKTIKSHSIHDEWLYSYQKLAKKNKSLVQVHDVIDNNIIKMEYIDFFDSVENILKRDENYYLLNKDIICDIIIEINNSWSQSIKYSKELENDLFFVNCDFSLDNVVLTKDFQIKIIDPDSYVFTQKLDHTDKYYMLQVNLMYKLQKYFLGK